MHPGGNLRTFSHPLMITLYMYQTDIFHKFYKSIWFCVFLPITYSTVTYRSRLLIGGSFSANIPHTYCNLSLMILSKLVQRSRYFIYSFSAIKKVRRKSFDGVFELRLFPLLIMNVFISHTFRIL